MPLNQSGSFKRDCVFCKIIARKFSARIVHETSDVLCFLPLKMEVYGHTLIVPKVHCSDIYDAPVEALAAVARCGKELAAAYRAKIGATGVNLLHASGKDAEQSVFHFHTHLLPRFPDDGLSTWPRLPEKEFDHDEVLGRLKFG